MLTFVSSPYSNPEPDIEHQRYLAVCDFTAWLWNDRGMIPVSPIAHWHPIGRRNQLPTNAMAWVDWNRCMVERADLLYVLCIDGWRDSIGVGYEIHWAKQQKLSVFYATKTGPETYVIKATPPMVRELAY